MPERICKISRTVAVPAFGMPVGHRVGQPVGRRRVEVDQALVGELHHDDRGHQLGLRGDLVGLTRRRAGDAAVEVGHAGGGLGVAPVAVGGREHRGGVARRRSAGSARAVSGAVMALGIEHGHRNTRHCRQPAASQAAFARRIASSGRSAGSRRYELARTGRECAWERTQTVYAGWKADPEGFWMRAAAGDRLDRGRRPGRSMPAARRSTAGSRTRVCNACWNAVDRHVEAGHGERVAIIHDSPMTGGKASHHLRRAARPGGRAGGRAGGPRRRQGRPGRRSTCRWCPRRWSRCSPARGIGAIHSVVFGGFAAPELAVRIDDARPKAIIAASCGIEPGRVDRLQAAGRRGDRDGRRTSRTSCIMLQRPQQAPAELGPRDVEWHAAQAGRGAGGLRAGRGDGPALHPLHLGHDRRAEGRGARDRRLSGGARLDDAEHLRHRGRATSSGRPPTSAGSSGIPTSATGR